MLGSQTVMTCDLNLKDVARAHYRQNHKLYNTRSFFEEDFESKAIVEASENVVDEASPPVVEGGLRRTNSSASTDSEGSYFGVHIFVPKVSLAWRFGMASA